MKRGAMKNISLAVLARQIGVGVATVDRVLNERGGVSPQTTRKVLQAAREAGYAFMQVKTVQMGKYAEYDATNRFYLAMGFREFEVFPQLWDEWNPCQVYVMGL